MESFGVEFFAKCVNALEVVIKGGDIEEALCGEGFGEGAVREADNDGEARLSREVGKVGGGGRVIVFGNETLGHVVHAGVEFVNGAESGSVVGLRTDAIGIAGVWLKILENEFVTEVFRSGFDDGTEFTSWAVGDDGFAWVARFPIEEGFARREESDRRADGEGNTCGFFGDVSEFLLRGEGVEDAHRRDPAIDGVEFVLVLISSDDEWGWDVRKDDRSGGWAGGSEDSVDIKLNFFAIVCPEEVCPVAGFE